MDNSSLINKISSSLDERKFEVAKNLIYEQLSKDIDIDSVSGATLKGQLAGFLIDLGDDSNDENIVKDGLAIFEKDRTQLCKFLSESSIEYNIGNANHVLFKIDRFQPDFEFKPEAIQLLTKAKNHYWKAYKLLSEKEFHLRPLLLTNLAISLSESGRIAESLQYLDQILKELPEAECQSI